MKFGPSAATYPSGASVTVWVVHPPLPSGAWYCSCDLYGEPVVYRSTK